MIESFFFIPASHPKLREKLSVIKADNLIIDLEDAVSQAELPEAVKIVLQLDDFAQVWLRPVVFQNGVLKPEVFLRLFKNGFRNFVLPKVQNLSQLDQLKRLLPEEAIGEIKVILLVENPECLLNLNLILQNTEFNIMGIGFGSQDFCTETGMKHLNKLLRLPRFLIFSSARAYNVKCIDIASMDISGGKSFQDDLKDTLEMGYDGKFIIHPEQLKIIQEYKYFTSGEVNEAYLIMNKYEQLKKPAVFIYNNRAVEPPHIQRYKEIIKWKENNERK